MKLDFNELLPTIGDEPGGCMHEGEHFSIGSRTFAAGEQFPAHYHEHFEEIFVAVRGVICVVVEGTRHDLLPGDKIVVQRGSVHSLVNSGHSPAEIAYLKIPFVDNDTVWVESASALENTSHADSKE